MDTQARERNEETAARLNVRPAIHPNDFIFRFVYDHPGFTSKTTPSTTTSTTA